MQQKKTTSIYLIFGEEYWLLKNHKQKIVDQVKKQYQVSRKIFNYELDFNWNEFNNEYYNNDLFSDKKIIEIQNLTNIKPKDQEVLAKLVINENNTLIITGNKITKRQKQANWFQKLNKAGTYIQCDLLNITQQISCMQEISQKLDLKLTKEELHEIWEQFEGNIIGAEQAMYQLKMIANSETITNEIIRETIHQKSTYKIYELNKALLNQDSQKVIKIIQQLKQQNQSFDLILWYFRKTIEEIHFLKANQDSDLEDYFVQLKIWGANKASYRKIIKNINNIKDIQDLITQANKIHELQKTSNQEKWVVLLHMHLYLTEIDKNQIQKSWKF